MCLRPEFIPVYDVFNKLSDSDLQILAKPRGIPWNRGRDLDIRTLMTCVYGNNFNYVPKRIHIDPEEE